LPYTWNGQTITQAGNYTHTSTSETHCEKQTTLTLTISNDIEYVNETIAICTNQLPYTWNGQTITQAGNYTHTSTSQTHCEKQTTLNLFILPSYNITIDSTISDKGLPITWFGETINSFGIYSHIVSEFTENGCDSTITYQLFVKNSNIDIQIDPPDNEQVIVELPNKFIFIPNSFTPNGGQVNELFKPIITMDLDMKLNNYLFEIYDRWGELIFRTDDVNVGWDGLNKKKQSLPIGTYSWRLFIVINNETYKQSNGHVNLIR